MSWWYRSRSAAVVTTTRSMGPRVLRSPVTSATGSGVAATLTGAGRGPAGKGVATGKVTAPRRWSSASARRALPRQRWPCALVQFSQSHTRSAKARRLRVGS
jgi:hypothetical protein